MRILPEDSLVMVVDYQERLMPAMANQEALLTQATRWLLGVKLLGIPTILTQQNTKGLGMSVEAIRSLLGSEKPYFEKIAFSALADEAILREVESQGRGTLVLGGIEAHVCVLQTAIDAKALGYEVVVVSDCIDSRNPRDKEIALRRMEQEGIWLTTSESILLEWLQGAGDDRFREMLKIIK
ncbi:MAG: hydrolase [Wolinella succinogenes]|uniref:hydrolase n=1 Tax=Wolinella succinogenes TaxID=844 RepID=UPI0016900312|nr:hydrolase [Wolinella succinogenes]NLU34624.1 hydrolase [Wolinella succinogenes]